MSEGFFIFFIIIFFILGQRLLVLQQKTSSQSIFISFPTRRWNHNNLVGNLWGEAGLYNQSDWQWGEMNKDGGDREHWWEGLQKRKKKKKLYMVAGGSREVLLTFEKQEQKNWSWVLLNFLLETFVSRLQCQSEMEGILSFEKRLHFTAEWREQKIKYINKWINENTHPSNTMRATCTDIHS